MFLTTPSMHGIAAITGNMHCSLRYFVLLERITSFSIVRGSELAIVEKLHLTKTKSGLTPFILPTN